MKIKTLFGFLLLLFLVFNSTSCGSAKVGENPATVAEAEEILAKKTKKQNKIAKKEKRKAYKAYWNKQSKDAHKSVKRNAKRQRKLARQKKRA
jgi:DNA-directed RNA polymerase subunit F